MGKITSTRMMAITNGTGTSIITTMMLTMDTTGRMSI